MSVRRTARLPDSVIALTLEILQDRVRATEVAIEELQRYLFDGVRPVSIPAIPDKATRTKRKRKRTTRRKRKW